MKTPMSKEIKALDIVTLGKFIPNIKKENGQWYARWECVDETDNYDVDKIVRSACITRLSEDAEYQRHETLHDAWLMALKSRTGLVHWDDKECEEFSKILSDWHKAVRLSDKNSSVGFRFSAENGIFKIYCARQKSYGNIVALGRSPEIFGPLRELKADGEDLLSVELSKPEAERFLKSAAKELSEAGYTIEGCDIDAKIEADAEIKGSLAKKCETKISIKINGETASEEEIRVLLEQKSEFVSFRDRWIKIDRAALKESLRLMEKARAGKNTLCEALSFAYAVDFPNVIRLGAMQIKGKLCQIINSLKNSAGAKKTPTDLIPETFNGTLRDYQKRAVSWLKFLTNQGLNPLLADDMGLGKTIQSIAWILSFKEKNSPFLIVAPLTLIPNWKHEVNRFAPNLNVYIHHGDRRQLEKGFKIFTESADIVLTNYNTLVKDIRLMRSREWSGIILDEAQAIKNPETAVSRSVKSIPAACKLALTGTPVENSAADIWSIEDFLNPGLLGNRKDFIETFVKCDTPKSRSISSERLKKILEPFVLRRLKTDPSIVPELGPKMEIKEYCNLADSQRIEYESALEDYRIGERRHGDAFALLTKLKIICDGEGKFLRLRDLLLNIFESGESALVFSQYVSVGKNIVKFLEKEFGTKTPFLHGGLTTRDRQKEIKYFSEGGPKAFVLSLKAGAYGLNLTKATHVIHFDRWWNPAVENQATDRAHRIGQTKTVWVHSFITEGTIEERIDNILESKRKLSDGILEAGESFFKGLSPEEIEKLASLQSKSAAD
jgi:SNF2 family DNA or RNA helicase